MPRLFLGLPLPEKLRNRLAEEADRLRLAGAAVSWVRKENYHVTVRFLGEVADEELLQLDPVLQGAAGAVPPLRLEARGLGAFPDARRPRVLWCGVGGEDEDHDEALAVLRAAVEDGLTAAGYRRDKAPFRPHVTLGRLRSPRNAQELIARMGPSERRPFGVFRCPDVVLFESTSSRQGSVYTELRRFPLGG